MLANRIRHFVLQTTAWSISETVRIWNWGTMSTRSRKPFYNHSYLYMTININSGLCKQFRQPVSVLFRTWVKVEQLVVGLCAVQINGSLKFCSHFDSPVSPNVSYVDRQVTWSCDDKVALRVAKNVRQRLAGYTRRPGRIALDNLRRKAEHQPARNIEFRYYHMKNSAQSN